MSSPYKMILEKKYKGLIGGFVCSKESSGVSP